MSHYAKVINGRVVDVINAEKDYIDARQDSSIWFQTSYNTRGNVHHGPNGLPDNNPPLRGNYAVIGGTYDHTNDVFINPKPFHSWVLDNTTWLWKAPVDKPNDNKEYYWDENAVNWVEVK